MIDEPKIGCFYKQATQQWFDSVIDPFAGFSNAADDTARTGKPLTEFERGVDTSHIIDSRRKTPGYYGSMAEDTPTTPTAPGVGNMYKSVNGQGTRAYSIPYLASSMGVSSKKAGEYLDKVNAARSRDPNRSFNQAWDSYNFAPDVYSNNLWTIATDGEYNSGTATDADISEVYGMGPFALPDKKLGGRGGLLTLNSGVRSDGTRFSTVPSLVNTQSQYTGDDGLGTRGNVYKRNSNANASTGISRHPYTNLSMAGLFGMNSDFSHEFNHLLNTTPDVYRSPINPLNDLVSTFRANRSGVFEPYGGDSVEEATQQASSMKQLAANLFAREHGGNLPDTDDEWRWAFTKALGNDNVNPEQVRFKNYMTPVQDNMSPEDRKTIYRKNVGRFIDTLMKRNSAGDRLLDLIVKNDYDGAAPGSLGRYYDV